MEGVEEGFGRIQTTSETNIFSIGTDEELTAFIALNKQIRWLEFLKTDVDVNFFLSIIFSLCLVVIILLYVWSVINQSFGYHRLVYEQCKNKYPYLLSAKFIWRTGRQKLLSFFVWLNCCVLSRIKKKLSATNGLKPLEVPDSSPCHICLFIHLLIGTVWKIYLYLLSW